MKRPEAPSGNSVRRRVALLAGSVLMAVASLSVAFASGSFDQNARSVTLTRGTAADTTATCDGRQHVNFGGFKTNTDGHILYDGAIVWPGAMGPKGSDTDKWSVEGSSNENADYGSVLTSLAYCKGGKEPKVVRHKEIIGTGPETQFHKVEATCPDGKNVIGGGWSAQNSDPLAQGALAIMGLERTSNRTWQVSVSNTSYLQQGVTAIALCGNEPAPITEKTQVKVHNADDATATAKCPNGKQVVFGGFKGSIYENGGNAFIFSFYLAGDDAIKVYGANNSSDPFLHPIGYMTAIAYCG